MKKKNRNDEEYLDSKTLSSSIICTKNIINILTLCILPFTPGQCTRSPQSERRGEGWRKRHPRIQLLQPGQQLPSPGHRHQPLQVVRPPEPWGPSLLLRHRPTNRRDPPPPCSSPLPLSFSSLPRRPL
jgi:hypothetical protein